MDELTNNYYSSNWHIGDNSFANFLSKNAQEINSQITKDTLEMFFMSMCSPQSDYMRWVGFVIANTLDSDIDINLKCDYTHESKIYSLNYMSCVCVCPNYLAFEKLYRLGAKPSVHNVYALIYELSRGTYHCRTENASKILEFYGKTNSIKEGYAMYVNSGRYYKGLDEKLDSLGITDYKKID
jgi:hypothetical protein